MNRRGWELVTTDKSAFVTKSLLDPIVVEDGQGYTGFPDPSSTDESDWTEVFNKVNNVLD